MNFDAPTPRIRPVLVGRIGAVSAAHPLATAAGQAILARGGSAADAAIAAQAVLCVVMPNACGLGGDVLALVRQADGTVRAVNGSGKSPRDERFCGVADDGTAVTVPGLVAGWHTLHTRYGVLPMTDNLAHAVRLAEDGVVVGHDVARAIVEQQERLRRSGAAEWTAALAAGTGRRTRQPELAKLLADIAEFGPDAFYKGAMADAVAKAVTRCGGYLSPTDLAAHETGIAAPVRAELFGLSLLIQPPPTQGVLLAMVANQLDAYKQLDGTVLQHAAIELTAASFDFRARAFDGDVLLNEPLAVDLTKASGRLGPRAYLHTAGVAAADANGMVVSSLVSLFDNFGSCILVPEGGFVLNNRANGFTVAPNHAAPAKFPIHTLSPVMVVSDDNVIGLATPGADGQIQTLLQIIVRLARGESLAAAIDAPRWRSEEGGLLVETVHPHLAALAGMGHDTVELAEGDARFGAVVASGFANGNPIACSDWRGEVWSGVM